MPRPRLLDLFCGGFGAGWGYVQAGFDVTGVDFVKRRQRPPGVEFIEADCLDVLDDVAFLRSFDLIHASPPCKVHTTLSNIVVASGDQPKHPDLLAPTRDRLNAAGVPYIIENVPHSPMTPHVVLCGCMFGLRVDIDGESWSLKRHRWFELCGWGNHGFGLQPEDNHPPRARYVGVWGEHPGKLWTRPKGEPGPPARIATRDQARDLFGMPWASWASLTQAIPPVYTEYLGRAFLQERSE